MNTKEIECPDCYGTGLIIVDDSENCETCMGEGFIKIDLEPV